MAANCWDPNSKRTCQWNVTEEEQHRRLTHLWHDDIQKIVCCTTVCGSKILETLHTHISGVGYTYYRNPYSEILCSSQRTRDIWCSDIGKLHHILLSEKSKVQNLNGTLKWACICIKYLWKDIFKKLVMSLEWQEWVGNVIGYHFIFAEILKPCEYTTYSKGKSIQV